MIDDNFKHNYIFQYTNEDTSKSVSKIYDEGVMWSEVLNDFVDYLSFVYGYDIKDKVRVESPFWRQRGFDVDDTGGWKGEFFDPEPKEAVKED
jgi:hypothetical protein